jgi:hypothetical protein
MVDSILIFYLLFLLPVFGFLLGEWIKNSTRKQVAKEYEERKEE